MAQQRNKGLNFSIDKLTNSIEVDFIGGEQPLTKAEELALSQYFLQKKNKNRKPVKSAPSKKKSKLALQAH